MAYVRLAALCAVPLLATAAHADPIIVESKQVTTTQWTDAVQKQIEQTGQAEMPGLYLAARSGRAIVAFSRGEDGTAQGVTLAERSGSALMDRQAVRLVSKLTHLPPLPAHVGATEMVQANILFAEDSREQQRLLRKLALASTRTTGVRTALALNVAISAASR